MSTSSPTNNNNKNISTTSKPTLVSSTQPMQAHAVRLGPGTELVPALLQLAAQTKASSCCVLTAVGSLSRVKLRMAGASSQFDTATTAGAEYLDLDNECVEIVSLVGTFSHEGGSGKHLHMSVSRRDGSVLGGHLMSARVFTTLELVLGTLPGVSFTREMDTATGYTELMVRREETSPR